MKTELVMCIELTSTMPSCTPLFRIAASTCGVKLTKAIFDGMFSVRYSVWDFMNGSPDAKRPAWVVRLIQWSHGRLYRTQARRPGEAPARRHPGRSAIRFHVA